ncbi:DUF4113 domain-containing protein [Alishewanella longhuensis]|uniref:DUF4113 domain-containing protein n=1 Tax=Alishewanella longhuensis TaxID=1091037 RepID=UPI0027E46718|nr:DUF4113 domain-containing protein [Alishewanella longhuensis]
MTVIDAINAKTGSKVWFASQGASQVWSMKRAMLSPAIHHKMVRFARYQLATVYAWHLLLETTFELRSEC